MLQLAHIWLERSRIIAIAAQLLSQDSLLSQFSYYCYFLAVVVHLPSLKHAVGRVFQIGLSSPNTYSQLYTPLQSCLPHRATHIHCRSRNLQLFIFYISSIYSSDSTVKSSNPKATNSRLKTRQFTSSTFKDGTDEKMTRR